MSAVADARGLKRICTDCGVRFYDLNKRPIICPECETEFTGEVKAKGRRGRVAAEPAPEKAAKKSKAPKEESKIANDDDVETVETDEDVVSLDDVEEAGDDDNDDDDADAVTLDDGELDAGIEKLDEDEDLSADIDIPKDKNE